MRRRSRSRPTTHTHAARVVRVDGRAVVDVFAGKVVGVFAHVQCTEQNAAGVLEACDQRRVPNLAGATPSAYLLAGGCLNCHSQVHGSNSPSGRALMR